MVVAELAASRAIAKAIAPPSTSRTAPEEEIPPDLEAQTKDSDDEQVDLGPYASSVSGTSGSSVQVKKDVFLNFEVLRAYQHKVTLSSTRLSILSIFMIADAQARRHLKLPIYTPRNQARKHNAKVLWQ